MNDQKTKCINCDSDFFTGPVFSMPICPECSKVKEKIPCAGKDCKNEIEVVKLKDGVLLASVGLPFCPGCIKKVTDRKPPSWFFIKWQQLKYIIWALQQDWCIERQFSKECEPISLGGPGAPPNQVITREITDREFYNLADDRWYGSTIHATCGNFIMVALVCKKFRREKTDPNIDFFIIPVNVNKKIKP